MVKIVISCALLLVVSQLAAARSFEVGPVSSNSQCAIEMANAIHGEIGGFVASIRDRLLYLLNERRRCSELSGIALTLCQARYRAMLIYSINNLTETIRNEHENFEQFIRTELDTLSQCLQSDNVMEDFLNEITGNVEGISALELRDFVSDIDDAYRTQALARTDV